jgi:photosystem II stability/assembly factor-like uncharacterized protein
MKQQVYVGVSNRTGGDVSGLYRRAADRDAWELCGLPARTHVHAIAVQPDDNAVIYAATSSGLWRTQDQGGHWKCVVPAEGREQMWSVLIHPADPRVILAGTAPLGVHRSDDGGETWHHLPRPDIAERMVDCFPSRIMRMAATPNQPDVIWAGMEVNGAMRSENGGESWTDLSDNLVTLSEQPNLASAILSKDPAEGMLDVHALAVSPAAPDTPFLALRMGLFKGEHRGATWTDLGIGQHAARLRYGRDIVVAPWNANTLFACVSDKARGEEGRLYKSEDLGRTWSQLDRGIAVHSTLMGVALDRYDPSSIHCATRGGQTFSSSDGGESWRELPLPEGSGAAVAVACG